MRQDSMSPLEKKPRLADSFHTQAPPERTTGSACAASLPEWNPESLKQLPSQPTQAREERAAYFFLNCFPEPGKESTRKPGSFSSTCSLPLSSFQFLELRRWQKVKQVKEISAVSR